MSAPKIYTKRGDKGETSLYNGTRVSKNHFISHTLGELDEFNDRIGSIKILLNIHDKEDKKIFADLEQIQHNTMNMSSWIATPNATEFQKKRLPNIDDDLEKDLEKNIDKMTEALPVLKNFILPGHNELAVRTHLARTQARKCERFIVGLEEDFPIIKKYFNRMSDYLFTLGRWFSRGNDVLHTKK